MPRIEHIAIWCRDLDVMKHFYSTYFEGVTGEKYHNPEKSFSSYFLTFEDGSRLELMQKVGFEQQPLTNSLGWAHIAMSVGSREAVDELTSRLGEKGFVIVSRPRTTGDGYYESVVIDPEGNHVKITI